MYVVGLFGLSGVGKSFFSEKIKVGMRDFTCARASDLIKLARGEVFFNKLNRTMVQRNQQILSKEFAAFKVSHPNKNILIELHNIIETPEGIEFLGGEVFDKFELTHVVFLQLEPDILYQQRLNDTGKTRRHSSVSELRFLQEKAKCLCKETFSSRGIPFKVLESDDENNIIKFLDFINKKSL